MSEINDGETLWAWVTREPDGNVSQVGAWLPELGAHAPLIHRNREVIERFRPLAVAHGAGTGQRVWLREYTGIIDHDEA